MVESIGVTCIDPWFVFDNDPLLKDLFYFDKLYVSIDQLETLEKLCISFFGNNEKFKNVVAEIERLSDVGLIKEYTIDQYYADSSKIEDPHIYIKHLEVYNLALAFTADNRPFKEMFIDFLERFRETSQLNARIYSSVLERSSYADYTPIIRSRLKFGGDSQELTKGLVLGVVIDRFPSISVNTDLSALIEFKQDQDARLKLARLRNWALELGRSNFSPVEIEQKLEHLLLEYENQLKLHRLKYTLGTVETFVVNALEVIEGLVKLNFSKAAKTLFDLKKHNVALLEAENNSVGKEVAFIHRSNELFSKKKN